MKIRPVGTALIYVDGQTDDWTDVTKAIDDFCEYANAPKMANIQGGPKVGIQYIVYTVYLLLAHPVYFELEAEI